VTPTAADRGASSSPAEPTTTLHWAVRLLLGEAVVVGLLTLLAIWAAVTTSGVSVQSAAATPVFTALCGAVLAGLGVALGRKKALARGPAIVLEMLMMPMGYYMVVGGLAWLGVPMIVLGLLGAGLLLAPSTRTALGLS
jgi:hypothetical protein